MTDEFATVTAADVTDDKLVAGELRALRVEMRSWFERLILRLDHFDGRITALEQHRADANERLSSHEIRIAALEAAATRKP